ncbi:tumor necrosis factor receptor superfamily member 1A-like isoform X1 [Ursus maritimus]|uniref:Tumor necrosis factor receptor superfamily member 1A-like isoform X1 n=1 Tax=Ursus maritimus TaxID=29073 RepID=A0A8M1GIP7_URSMA|nr:tumor necrosis factor receptor superfamily member 1A-like isoform X1 [Ursus maritimus]
MGVLWRALCGLCLCALPLIRGAAVPLPGAEPNCGPEEYKPDGLGLCCRKCPAGFHVSRHCGVNHGMPICDPCEPGSFLTYPNGETSCQPCAKCREDQEMVAVCTRTSNQKCQCKTGSFYCDSPDCTESCYRCRRCSGATLRPCNATSDTVCDTEPGPEAPGEKKSQYVSGYIVAVVIVIAVLLFLIIYCCKGQRKLAPAVSRLTEVIVPTDTGSVPFSSCWSSGRAEGPGSTICRQHSESLLPSNPESDGPAPDLETSSSCHQLEEDSAALQPEPGPQPGPSEEAEEGAALQQMVVGASPVAPEQALCAVALAAPGPQDQPAASLSLRALEQEYETNYFVKDSSNEGRIYYGFEERISDKDWKTFMRLVGLEDIDIEKCERENRNDVTEQHHQMLLRWRTQLGRGASVFKLFAALHKMQLHMHLENIINGLLAEGILGRRGDTSDYTSGLGLRPPPGSCCVCSCRVPLGATRASPADLGQPPTSCPGTTTFSQPRGGRESRQAWQLWTEGTTAQEDRRRDLEGHTRILRHRAVLPDSLPTLPESH